jgi:hypothetical protein
MNAAKTKKAMRLMVYLGLLCLETILLIGFYIIPQFQARNAPEGHWEMETPLHDGPALWIALVAFLGLVTAGNVGLIIMIWRGFKDLKANDLRPPAKL